MTVPTDLKYTTDHEWLRIDGDTATVGITSFAADALGDIVYVDLPAEGKFIEAGKPCGEIESTKSVSDLYAPVDGEVIEINDAVVQDGSLINDEPFAGGWLFRVKVSREPELLDANGYLALTVGESHV